MFLPGHIEQPPRNGLRVQAAEIVPLAAGEDGGQHLVEFGGGQDKHQVLRRLLEDLQQRVEGALGEHMHLVDDVHALFRPGRGEHRLVPEDTHIVHAVVGGGVQLRHIQQLPPVKGAAVRAAVAGVAVDGVLAVHRLGQNTGAGGLSGAPGADEKVGVGEAAGAYLHLQRLGNVFLTHHLVKIPGAVFSIQRLVHSLPSFSQKQKQPLARLHTRPRMLRYARTMAADSDPAVSRHTRRSA